MSGRSDLLTRHYWPSSDVRLRVVSGEAILLDLASEEIFRLNDTGTRIWQELAVHHDPSTVIEVLSAELGVEPWILGEDLEILIRQLLDAGLVTDRSPRDDAS